MCKSQIIESLLKKIFQTVERILANSETITSPSFYLLTPSGMERLESTCMLLIAIGEGVKGVDKLTDKKGSVVILGGLSLVNSLHAYTFASLKRKKLISTTPLNDALNALILALNASAAAFVLLFTKKFKILS